MTRFSWTQPICDDCFEKRHPGQPGRAARITHPEWEECVDCGMSTNSGIYIRVDPAEAFHPTIERMTERIHVYRPTKSVEKILAETRAISYWVSEQVAKGYSDDDIVKAAPLAIAFINGDITVLELREAMKKRHQGIA